MIRYISSLLAAFVMLVMAGSAHAALMWNIEADGIDSGTIAFSDPSSTDSGATITQFSFEVPGGTAFFAGQSFDLSDVTGTPSWEINSDWQLESLNLQADNLVAGLSIKFPTGFDYFLQFTCSPCLAVVNTGELSFTPIPEPSTIGLFAIGLVGVGVMTRRRRKQIAAG